MLIENKLEGKNIETMSGYQIIDVAQNKLTMVSCLMKKYDIFEPQTIEWTKIIE